MEVVIGIIIGILALLGFKNLSPKDLPPELSDDRKEELEEKLDDLEKREEELKQGEAPDLKPEEVEDYWKNKR
jgi:sugar-specific transcriptional regulator TrmB